MKKFMMCVGLIVLNGCAARTVKVLDAPWVSMKNPGPPAAGAKLVRVGPVEEEYCVNSWSGSYGLMDEVTKQAEKKHGIDYVRSASFTKTEGTSCVQLSGEGYRVQ